jgi:hypothetical protein
MISLSRARRRYFATKHYNKYLSLLKTAQALGLRNINNARRYIDLETVGCQDYEVQVATTVEEGKKLGEAGYEYYDTIRLTSCNQMHNATDKL